MEKYIIDHRNYEEHLLEYFEGSLNPDQEFAMRSFLEEHPEIASALEGFEVHELSADETIVYEDRDALIVENRKPVFILRFAAIAASLTGLALVYFFLIQGGQNSIENNIANDDNSIESPLENQPDEDIAKNLTSDTEEKEEFPSESRVKRSATESLEINERRQTQTELVRSDLTEPAQNAPDELPTELVSVPELLPEHNSLPQENDIAQSEFQPLEELPKTTGTVINYKPMVVQVNLPLPQDQNRDIVKNSVKRGRRLGILPDLSDKVKIESLKEAFIPEVIKELD